MSGIEGGTNVGARVRLRIFASISALVIVLAFAMIWSGAAGAATWLENQGFDSGLSSWAAQPVAGTTVVSVGPEGPSQFPIYGTMFPSPVGPITVTPVGKPNMLRLGLPKGTDSNQIKGVESVTQTFTSDGRQIDLAYRIFTADHRSGDTFVIDVKDALSGKSVAGAGVGVKVGSSATVLPLPYSAPISIAKTAKYWESGWQNVRITGLPAGKSLTISYTLSNSTNAAHDTWVYVDHRNSVPVAGTVAITPKPVYKGSQTFTARTSGFSDPDGDTLAYTYAWTKNGAPAGGGDTLSNVAVAKSDEIKVSVTASDGTVSTAAVTDSVIVSNSAPKAGTVAITPNLVYTKGTLTATADFSDADNDTLTYGYAWTKNGGPISGATGSSLDLSVLGGGDKGDKIAVKVTASDGSANAEAVSEPVTVLNSPPVAGTVAIAPNPAYTDSKLTAPPVGFTDDDGDTLTYTYAWTKTAAAISGATDSTLVSTPVVVGTDSPDLDLSVEGNGDKGDVIAVGVTASDGEVSTAAVTDSLTVLNSAPVADFTWAPGGPDGPEGQSPHEGDVIGLYSDPSQDADGQADIVKWKWQINKSGETEEVYNKDNDFRSPIGFIVPYDDGAYEVTLTVTDSEGLEGSALDTIVVENYRPRVNALNIEVLRGGMAKLVGRFLDPGWKDDHTADWMPEGGSAIAGDVKDDHLSALDSGYVDGTVTAGSTTGESTWSLDVHDGGGDPGTAAFKVSVIDPNPDRFEDQDAFPNVHSLNSGGAYLSYIRSEGDIDIYEVKTPDGKLLPKGTEVLATLRDLPADYDLAVFQGVTGSSEQQSAQAAPFMHSPFSAAPFMQAPFMHSPAAPAPFMHSPFMHSPYEDAPIMQAPFMHSPFMHSPYSGSPYVNTPFMHSPFMHSPFMHSPIPVGWSSLDGYPLSEMSYTEAENNNTSGIDIAFNELGFNNEAMQSLQILGFSANTGTKSEVVLATASHPQTVGVAGHVFVAVKGTPGNYSSTLPYTLQIETSRPLDLLSQLQVDQPALVATPSSTTDVEFTPEGSPLTLFVTQLQRLASLYPGGATLGDSRDGGEIVKAALVSVADRSDVKGKIISLPGNLYTAWDKQPWRVDLANDLAQSLRDVIQAQLTANPTIQYVVLVGSDRVVPFRRLVDQTVIGNEQGYQDQAFILPPSATLSSIAGGYILTDDFYVDQTPISWSGSYLYAPDLAVSRLVEKPAEIAGSIKAFIDANGVLTPAAAVVSGHSFMADGAAAVRHILTDAGVTMLDTGGSLIGETWTGTDLWNALKLAPDVTSLNSHFTHFAGLSAYGYGQSVAGGTYDGTELLLSGDVAAATTSGDPLFKSKLVFSMGCHSGLSVPDEQAVAATPGDPIIPGLDLPQAMMQQGGVYLGSTGYGYMDTVGIAGTEALIGVFAEKLVGGATSPAGSVGLALVQAKQAYLGSLSTLTPYEQKSSVEYEMYGMPQYHLPTTTAAVAAPVAAASLTMAASVELAPFRLKLSERSMQTAWTNPTADQSYAMARNSAPTGDYVTADGRSEANPERPLHPLITVPLPEQPDQGPVHGFVYKTGSYANLGSEGTFKPAISRITNEWEERATEFEVAASGFWPSEPGLVTTIQRPTGYDQAFLAVPAQFSPTATTPEVVGTERVWSYLEAEVLRSSAPATGSEDWTPPSVLGYDLWMTGGKVTLSVDARDASGISRIVALVMGANGMSTPVGGDHSFGNPGVPNGPGGRYEVTFDPAGVDPAALSLMIQVVDGAGNVTTLTGKGATVHLLPTGLRNPGFEEGLKYWDVSMPAGGSATVVGTQGPNQPSIFRELHISVDPYTGVKMLRLGAPKDEDSHQIKGVTSASQQFISDGQDIVVAYRVISFEGRAEDVFSIDVKDAAGSSVGAIAGKALPYKVSLGLHQEDHFYDSRWVTVTITGLEKGKAYTLSYALSNTKDSSHDTWVYVDLGK